MLATLIGQVHDFQLAEDAVQDTFASAVDTWQRAGVPINPGAWLTLAAQRRAIDRCRHERSLADRAGGWAELTRIGLAAAKPGSGRRADRRRRSAAADLHVLPSRLGLSAQVVLALRTLGVLTTGKIAHAFLVSEPTMGKRLVRANRKVAGAHIPYRVLSGGELPDRPRGVLGVGYLIFNEGYLATEGDQLVRGELGNEAIRLGRLLHELLRVNAEVSRAARVDAYHVARRSARDDEYGRFVTLGDRVAEPDDKPASARRSRAQSPSGIRDAPPRRVSRPMWEAADGHPALNSSASPPS